MTPYDRAWDMGVYTEYVWVYDGICQVVRISDEVIQVACHEDSTRLYRAPVKTRYVLVSGVALARSRFLGQMTT